MSQQVSRKRIKRWSEIKGEEDARSERAKRQENVEETIETVEEAYSLAPTDDSIVLPTPTDSLCCITDDQSSSEDDYEGDEFSARYQDWMRANFIRENLHMMAMMMYDHFRNRFMFMRTRAAEEVQFA